MPDLLSTLAPALEEIDGLRRTVRQRAKSIVGSLAIVWVIGAAVLVALSGVASLIPIAIIGLVISAIALFEGLSGPSETYRQAFKARVIGRLVADRYQDAAFHAGGGIGQAQFEASRLYQQGIDRYSSEDLIEARLGETPFRMAEIHAEYKTTSWNGKRVTTHWHTIFKGRFLVALFNKRFHGTTLVMSEGWWLSRPSGLERVALEDPTFDKLFAVYSTDQIEARYLLSPSLMERLTACRQRLDAPVQAAFMDDHVILAIPDPQDRFEPPPVWSSRPLLSEADLQAYAADIALAADLIGELNLNRRIWERG